MPGPYSKPKGVTITGAGNDGVKKSYVYYSQKVGDIMHLPKKAKKALSRFRPLIKSWEDRNVSNNGSKLNP